MMIKISVTKEIYRRSMMCPSGKGDFARVAPQNCAIALSVREIAPDACVYYDGIYWSGNKKSHISNQVREFIIRFDALANYPELRLDLPEFSFSVDFPDELVEQMGIDQVREILTNSETLQLVEI